MFYLIGQYSQIGWTALKTVLLFTVAIIGLRVSRRRMLAELNIFDFVVAVAIGAIIGRTATSLATSFVTGAVALITLCAIHRVVAECHRRGWLGGLLTRKPLILLARGRLQATALRTAGLADRDVYRLLRQAGESDVNELEYVLFEERGEITIVRAGQPYGEAIRVGLAEAGIENRQ